MTARENYRDNAAHCLRLARSSGDVYTRLTLVSMAQAWIRLAEQNQTADPAAPPDLRHAS